MISSPPNPSPRMERGEDCYSGESRNPRFWAGSARETRSLPRGETPGERGDLAPDGPRKIRHRPEPVEGGDAEASENAAHFWLARSGLPRVLDSNPVHADHLDAHSRQCADLFTGKSRLRVSTVIFPIPVWSIGPSIGRERKVLDTRAPGFTIPNKPFIYSAFFGLIGLCLSGNGRV